ncbi:hypothetical protein JCM6882_008205 [Rhodosporidiobolus microsporus]
MPSSSSHGAPSDAYRAPPAKRRRIVVEVDLAISCTTCGTAATLSEADLRRVAQLVTARLEDQRPAVEVAQAQLVESTAGKKSRTRMGCETCKQRHVKCDQGKPVCANCRKDLNRVCRYAVMPRSAGHEQPRSEDEAPEPAPADEDTTEAGALQTPPQDPTPAPPPGTSSLSRALDLFPDPNQPELHSVPSSRGLVVTGTGALQGDFGSPAALPLLPPPLLVFYFQQAIHVVSNVALAPCVPHKASSRQTHIVQLLWQSLYAHAVPQARLLLYSALSLGAVFSAYFNPDPAVAEAGRATSAQLYSSAMGDLTRLSTNSDPALDEHILAAFYFLFYRVCIAADTGWARQQSLMINYLLHRGGPDQLLHDHTNPASHQRVHRHLVLLVASEVIASLFHGRGAGLLSSSSSTRWIEDSPQSELIVEEAFGMSLCLLFAAVDVCDVVAQVELATSGIETESNTSMESLLQMLDVTCLATIYARSSSIRIQAGNFLYRHALICHLLLHGYRFAPEHPRIQQSSAAILELLIELTATTGLVACVQFPLLVGASVAPQDKRERYLLLLQHMNRADLSYPLQVLEEVWRRLDNKLPHASVKAVLNDTPRLAFYLM